MPGSTSIEAAVKAAGRSLTGVRVFDVRHPEIRPHPGFDSLFVGVGGAAAAGRLRDILFGHYPPAHRVTIVTHPGSRQQRVNELCIADLEQAGEASPASVFVPALPAEQCATVEGLRAIVARLRSERGCPWDREQDHRSLRRCLLEETHEALAAIDQERWQELALELGDILLQVLFHAHLAAERGDFDFDDVVERLREKLIARHPHVFGDAVAGDAEAVLRRWEEIKRGEAGEQRASDLLAGVPPTLPALDRAQKVQRRASYVGFDWTRIEGPLAKLAEETRELKSALAQAGPGTSRVECEVGDILFAAVNVARFARVNAEQALRAAADRFAARFAAMQELAAEQGLTLEEMNLEQMDSLWERVKPSRPAGQQ